nr:DBF4-type zinc finger-containing protein 2 homolog [Aegilops tauschii subsp. strangulata]
METQIRWRGITLGRTAGYGLCAGCPGRTPCPAARPPPRAPCARLPSPHGRESRVTASAPSAAHLAWPPHRALCPSARLCAALCPLPAVRPPPDCARGHPRPSIVPHPTALPRSFQPPMAGEPEGQRQLQ